MDSIAGNDPLRGYSVPDPRADLFANAPADVAETWHKMAAGLAAICDGKLGEIHSRLQHETNDLGMTFRLSGDKDERPWPVSPMPLLLGTQEWADLTKGLVCLLYTSPSPRDS